MTYRNPPTAVDIVIEVHAECPYAIADPLVLERDPILFTGIVLIQRKNEPFKGKWALPGGFQEYGESLEETAVREAKEETGLEVKLITQLRTYSNPDRDPRGHVNAVGYIAEAYGIPKGGDDASTAKAFPLSRLPPLAFDHKKRIKEYLLWKRSFSVEEELE